MIFEHEIPSGSHLYFGEGAQVKRSIEQSAASLLEASGYQEIVTPLFSYHQHESFGSQKPLVRLNDSANHAVSLRADSTADVVRIVTKRLGRSSDVRRWFYIQPVFTFPTTEQYQIGGELIDGSFSEACRMALALLAQQDIAPIVQVANIAIPKLLNTMYGISLVDLEQMNIEAMLSANLPWMERLVRIHTVEDLNDLLLFPDDLKSELTKLRSAVERLESSVEAVISPLYYAKLRYYDALLFRMFEGNRLFARGGTYAVDDVHAAGFALYTDACIEKKLEKKGDHA